MNTQDIVTKVSEQTDIAKKDIAVVVSSLFSVISESLKSGEDVRLQSFGTFSVSETKEKQGRNPRTGAAITIAAGKKVKFGAGKALKESIV